MFYSAFYNRTALIVLVCIFSLFGCESIGSSDGIKPIDIVIGTYNQKGSEGIYTVKYDVTNQSFSKPRLVARADNPSFLAVTKNNLYVVNEVDPGRLSMYRRDGEFLKLEKMADVGGASPCYVSLSPKGDQLATANYMGGNVSIFQLSEGVLHGTPKVLQHEGSGPNLNRQEAPHAHWVQWHPNKKWIYAVDLGTDEIKVYDASTLEGKTAIKMAGGDGPRHLVWYPKKPIAYVLNELSNSLATLSINPDGTLTEMGRVSTLPKDFKEHSQAAHIAISKAGTRIYVSNRGHDSIAVFDSSEVGAANLVQHQSTGGNWPRHFSLVAGERLLIVANQESNNIMALEVDTYGLLGFAGAIVNVPQPTFVAPL